MRTPYAGPCPCLRLVLYVAVSHTAHHHRLVLDDLRLRADPSASYATERGAGGSFGGGVGSFLFEQEEAEAPERVLTYRTDNDTLVCTVVESVWTSRSGIHWCNLTLPRGGGAESGSEGGGEQRPASGCPRRSARRGPLRRRVSVGAERTYRLVARGSGCERGREAPMP